VISVGLQVLWWNLKSVVCMYINVTWRPFNVLFKERYSVSLSLFFFLSVSFFLSPSFSVSLHLSVSPLSRNIYMHTMMQLVPCGFCFLVTTCLHFSPICDDWTLQAWFQKTFVSILEPAMFAFVLNDTLPLLAHHCTFWCLAATSNLLFVKCLHSYYVIEVDSITVLAKKR